MTRFHLFFADWKARPGRTPEWRDERRANFPMEDMWRREYPETVEDSLLAADEAVFPTWALEKAGVLAGPAEPIAGHRYQASWDIGRLQDAAVGTIIDISKAPYQLVYYRRLVKQPYPVVQQTIEGAHNIYLPSVLTYVEDNNSGRAVIENLKVAASPFKTTGSSKIQAIMALKVALEQGYLQLWREPQLYFELSGYMFDDDGLVQDSVMSLAINLFCAGPPIHNFEQVQVAQTGSRTHVPGLRPATTSRVAAMRNSVSRANRRNNGQLAEDYL